MSLFLPGPDFRPIVKFMFRSYFFRFLNRDPVRPGVRNHSPQLVGGGPLVPNSSKYLFIADFIFLLLIGAVIYALASFGKEWKTEYNSVVEIDLSISRLPVYSLLSLVRAMIAYFFSLCFTLVVGYWAARSPKAEAILIPLLDIFQSIPVVGFLPALVLGMIAIFPRTNAGLELATILMIFTGQVWNMVFNFYSSLKSIPTDLREASTVMGLSWKRRFLNLDLPYSATGLVWNSLMSMAGGWFFLTICEAFTLGDKQFRLPGLGSYVAVAIAKGDMHAMGYGFLSMILLIVFLDTLLWRPLLVWAHRFRLEEVPGQKPDEPLIQIIVKHAFFANMLHRFGERFLEWIQNLFGALETEARASQGKLEVWLDGQKWKQQIVTKSSESKWLLWLKRASIVLMAIAGSYILVRFFHFLWMIFEIPRAVWFKVLEGFFWTFLRVLTALVLSSLWAVPVGIWIGVSHKRIRIFQPIIQILASFPAPMLYPLAIAVLFRANISFSFVSIFLMMLGVQWYILFNVLAGAMRIPLELSNTLELVGATRARRWFYLYLPSVFPALVTGLITAAGGAWNASIVAEYYSYNGTVLTTTGLGAIISQAVDKADFSMLTASLTVMVIAVVSLNRLVWSRVYSLAQNRFRMDM